jgi:hypothetical protein
MLRRGTVPSGSAVKKIAMTAKLTASQVDYVSLAAEFDGFFLVREAPTDCASIA